MKDYEAFVYRSLAKIKDANSDAELLEILAAAVKFGNDQAGQVFEKVLTDAKSQFESKDTEGIFADFCDFLKERGGK